MLPWAKVDRSRRETAEGGSVARRPDHFSVVVVAR